MTDNEFKDFLKKLGRYVQKIRKNDLECSQEAMDQYGLERTYYQRIEYGSANLTLRFFFRLAKAFRKKPSDLLKDLGL